MKIRQAVPGDLGAINAIYNEVVRTTNAIYTDDLMPEQGREAWFSARVAEGFPVFVAVVDGVVAGFASYGAFRISPSGYRRTVEGTVLIDARYRRHGIGLALLDGLVQHGRAAGMHQLIAAVDAENTASLAMLRRYGFTDGGLLREVGEKGGRLRDVCLLQFRLGGAPTE